MGRIGLAWSIAVVLVVPSVAHAKPPAESGNVVRYDLATGGPVAGDGLVAWLNIDELADLCPADEDDPPAFVTTSEVKDVTVRDGVVVRMIHGDVPFVLLDADTDPCASGAQALGFGEATLRFHDNDSASSGSRGNAFGVGFSGELDSGEQISGHVRYRVTKNGDVKLTTTQLTVAG